MVACFRPVPAPLPGREVITIDGAGGRSRTDTLLPEPDFESGASTNSATPAWAPSSPESTAFGAIAQVFQLTCVVCQAQPSCHPSVTVSVALGGGRNHTARLWKGRHKLPPVHCRLGWFPARAGEFQVPTTSLQMARSASWWACSRACCVPASGTTIPLTIPIPRRCSVCTGMHAKRRNTGSCGATHVAGFPSGKCFSAEGPSSSRPAFRCF